MNGKINIEYLFKTAFEDFEAQPSPEMLDNILGDAFDTSVKSSFSDFALTPSTHIWENINTSIPTEADKLLSTSFDEFAVTPPTHLWENISDSIPVETDKSLSASFDEFEVTPPTHLWENISESIPSEVDQILASSFNEFAVTPPADMWSSIQGELDVEENFDSKFQEAFAGFAPKPSEHILNNLLSSKFDTGIRRAFMRHEIDPQEAVWNRIKPYIRFGPVIQRHLPTIRRVAAVILCLFMFTFLYDQFDKNGGGIVITHPTKKNRTTKTKTNTTPAVTTSTENEAEQPLKSSYEDISSTVRTVSAEEQPMNREGIEESVEQVTPQFIPQSLADNGQKKWFDIDGSGSLIPPVYEESNDKTLPSPKFATARLLENERTDNSISSIPKVVSGLETYEPGIIISNPDLSDFNQLEVTTALRGSGNEYVVQSNLMDMEEDNDLAKMMLSYRGLYVSSSFMASNSWMLNEVVRGRLSDPDQGLMHYAVTTGKSFGFGIGYQLTPNFGVETEIQKSRLSQNYRGQTASNVYSKRPAAHADYFYIPISFKYQIGRSRSMNKRIPRTFSTVFGVHYGRLQNVDLRIEDREIPSNTEDYFIQQELGIFTGADYHFYISPNIHFTAGFRAAAGTGFEYLSAPFAAGTPYNVQVGGRLGLNYRFATRKYKWDRGIY